MSVWKQGPRALLPCVPTQLVQTPQKGEGGVALGRSTAGATLCPGPCGCPHSGRTPPGLGVAPASSGWK